jgi:hypothetical protein
LQFETFRGSFEAPSFNRHGHVRGTAMSQQFNAHAGNCTQISSELLGIGLSFLVSNIPATVTGANWSDHEQSESLSCKHSHKTGIFAAKAS